MVLQFFKNKDVLWNTTHNYLNKALNAIVPFFLIPYYNKMLGIEQYGILIYIQAIVALFIYVTDYGFIMTGTREVSVNAKNTAHLSSLVSSVIVVKAILTLLVFAALVLVSTALNVPRETLLLYSLTFMALTFQNFMPSWFFYGMKKNVIITIANALSKVLMLVLVLFFINQQSELWVVPFLEGISYFLFFAVGIILAYYSFQIRFILPDLKSLISNFSLSSNNFLITLMSWITTGGVLVITEQFVTAQSFGYYGIFTRICYYIFIGVHQINLSIFPYISERYARTREEGQALFVSISKVYMVFVCALLVGGLLLGNVFFNIFFDSAFLENLSPYMPAFYWLLLRITLLLANSYFGMQFFVANKKDRTYRNYYFVNALVSVAAGFVLVQWYGIAGAGAAAFLGEAVMFFLLIRKYLLLKHAGSD